MGTVVGDAPPDADLVGDGDREPGGAVVGVWVGDGVCALGAQVATATLIVDASITGLAVIVTRMPMMVIDPSALSIVTP
jgi:hypothetical protein